jgi:hypothetical protein
VSKVALLLAQMQANPAGVRFRDLVTVCEHYFGESTSSGTSHRVYRTPWRGDPRVNIQNDQGMAKTYQVRQVLKAINKMKETNHG